MYHMINSIARQQPVTVAPKPVMYRMLSAQWVLDLQCSHGFEITAMGYRMSDRANLLRSFYKLRMYHCYLLCGPVCTYGTCMN